MMMRALQSATAPLEEGVEKGTSSRLEGAADQNPTGITATRQQQLQQRATGRSSPV